ncbi:MAG: GH92 family glycosyl hydrolase [Thermoguttaceae bacterium]
MTRRTGPRSQCWFLVCLLAFGLLNFRATAAEELTEPVDDANPLIGTDGVGSEYGGVVPGVTHPFGMTQWLPMTRKNEVSRCAYNYRDRFILGFLGSHQPCVWMGDYGQVSLMPGVGPVVVDLEKRKLPFAHADETATPYSYSVTMNGASPDRIKVELSATTRAALLAFAFAPSAVKQQDAYLVIDASQEYSTSPFSERSPAEGWIRIDLAKREITGYNADRQSGKLGLPLPRFRGYFVIELDVPLASAGTYVGSKTSDGTLEARGDKVGGYVRLQPPANGVAKARVGTSFISVERARENLRREIPYWDLARCKAEGRAAWNRQLSKILVRGANRDARRIFYTAMYHSHLYPRIFSEGGQYYSAFDDRVHDGVSYNDYSLWDTFRGEHPLLTLTASERVGEMVTSLLQMYREGGWLPKWPNPGYTGIMIGSHADSVIADAWAKGLRGFDMKLAYEAVRKSAMVAQTGDAANRWGDRQPNKQWPETRGGLSWYMKLGYVPADRTDESISRTLEFAYDDFCDAQLAKAVGATDDYRMFMARSKNYRNVLKDGALWARTADGRWMKPSDATHPLTEGDAWTYLFCAMQDIPGLVERLGGPEAFAKKLDENFDGNHHRHNNEPGHHYPYLYDYCGQPWKTQQRVREVERKNYSNTSVGMTGNEDCGQMSAWYIFSSMGFYPVTPGTDVYAIGAPLWDEVRISIGAPYAPATFRITADNQSPENLYIQSATLDGVPLNRPFLKQADIVHGGHLHFVMGPRPNQRWGVALATDAARKDE